MLPRFRSNMLTGMNAIEFYATNSENQIYHHSIDTRLVVGVTRDPNEPKNGFLTTGLGTYRTNHTYQELVDLLYPHRE